MSLSEEQVMEMIQPFITQYQIASAVAVVAVIALVGVIIAWWGYEKYFTPLESHQIRQAFRKHFALMGLGGDDGYLDILAAPTSGPEGFLESKGVGITKEHYSGALPRAKVFTLADYKPSDSPIATVEDVEAKEGDKPKPEAVNKSKYSAQKTIAVANYISMLASRRLLLRGAKVPIWLAYRGKAIMTSLYGLAALQLVEALCNLVAESKTNPTLQTIADAFALVDILAIKDLFSQQWNESQLNAQEADKERKGELKARKFAGKESLILLFAIMIVLVVLVIIFMVAAWLISGGGQTSEAAQVVASLIH